MPTLDVPMMLEVNTCVALQGLLSFAQVMYDEHEERGKMGADKWKEMIHRKTRELELRESGMTGLDSVEETEQLATLDDM